jgi:integrase
MGRRKSGEMPRVSVVRPQLHARIRIGGRAYWLGKCDGGRVSDAQMAEAARLWQEHLSGVPRPPAVVATTAAAAPPQELHDEPAAGELTVADLALKYLDHAEVYYRRPDGSTTSSVDGIRMACRALFAYSAVPAASFGPRMLKTLRESLVREGRPRVTVNRTAKTIRRMFKWATSEDLVPGDVWKNLEAVDPLRKGRTEAPELPAIEEVPEPIVEATLPHLSAIVSAMVWFQRLTGARPGEVCLLRPCDIDRTRDVWVYSPPYHKLSWRETPTPRVIPIGPDAQRVITPFLLRSAEAYCFSPREAEEQRSRSRRLDRKSPLTPSQKARRPKRNGQRRPGEAYTSTSYRRAVHRAIEAANKLRAAAGDQPLPVWSPNQLRHLRAGELEERLGIEAANAVLGHADLRTTQIYARRKREVAIDAIRRLG